MKYLGILLGVGSSCLALAGEYTISDLGVVGDKPFRPSDLNVLGQIAGAIDGPVPETQLAYLWQNGQLLSLGTLGGQSSTPEDISDVGAVVGSSTLANGQTHPFYFSPSTGLVDLLATQPTEVGIARAINNHGQILVTRSDQLWLTDRAGIDWQPVASLPGLTELDGVGLTDDGWVVGRGVLDSQFRSFLSRNGAVEDLGSLPGFHSTIALAVNGQQHITGFVLGESTHRSFLWQAGRLQLAADLGGGWSLGAGINQEAIIGSAHSPRTNDSRAFRCQNGFAASLNDLIDGVDWELSSADDCAVNGQIVGSGLHNDYWRGYLATPVPEPSGILLLIVPVLVVARRSRHR